MGGGRKCLQCLLKISPKRKRVPRTGNGRLDLDRKAITRTSKKEREFQKTHRQHDEQNTWMKKKAASQANM